MIEAAIIAIAKAIADKRSILYFLGLFLMLGVGALVYDKYTGYSQLARIDRATTIVGRLAQLENNDKTEEVRSLLLKQLSDAIQEDSATPPAPPRLVVFVVGAMPWFFIAFGTLFYTPGTRHRDLFFGMLGIGLLVALICVFIPRLWWPWGHLLISPLAPFAIIVGVAIVIAIRKELN